MKTYGQYCAIAQALDTVGDRWTLLVLRELSNGERRYGQLQAALPGVPTNMLADRLKSLTESGLIVSEPSTEDRRTKLYRLGSPADDVIALLEAVAKFGLTRLPTSSEGLEFDVGWLPLALGAIYLPREGDDLRVQFFSVGERITVHFDGVHARSVEDTAHDLVVTGSPDALWAAIHTPSGVARMTAHGELTVEGPRARGIELAGMLRRTSVSSAA